MAPVFWDSWSSNLNRDLCYTKLTDILGWHFFWGRHVLLKRGRLICQNKTASMVYTKTFIDSTNELNYNSNFV